MVTTKGCLEASGRLETLVPAPVCVLCTKGMSPDEMAECKWVGRKPAHKSCHQSACGGGDPAALADGQKS